MCSSGRLEILIKVDDEFFFLEETLDDAATLDEPAREDGGIPFVCGGGGAAGVENEPNCGGTPTKWKFSMLGCPCWGLRKLDGRFIRGNGGVCGLV